MNVLREDRSYQAVIHQVDNADEIMKSCAVKITRDRTAAPYSFEIPHIRLKQEAKSNWIAKITADARNEVAIR